MKEGRAISSHFNHILLNIEDKPKFKVSIGQIRGHKAIRIEDSSPETEKINF